MQETHTTKAHFLYAFSQYNEIVNFIKIKCHESEMLRQGEILEDWQRAQQHLNKIITAEQNIANTVKQEKIPTRHNKLLNAYANDSYFGKTFPPHKSEFALVEIDKLVIAQRSVNIEHCNSLIEKNKKTTDFKKLLQLCLAPNNEQTTIQHLEPTTNSHMFSSPNSDLRFLGSYYKTVTDEDMMYAGGGHPVAAVVSFIGYGASPVSVFKVGSRILLSNGFHRVYALRALGIKMIPVVVQNISNAMIELPPQLHGVHREYLLNSPRPTMMKDFFDPILSKEFQIKRVLKAVQLQVTPNAIDIPY